jgi:phosphatidate cytidylyltransferase
LTGLIYIVVITGCILGGFYPFLALFSAVTIACLWEFYGLVNAQKSLRINRWYNCLGGLLFFLSVCLYASGVASPAIFLVCLAYLVSVFILELYGKRGDPITHSAAIFLGHSYITLPLSMLGLLAFPLGIGGAGAYNPVLLLALLIFIWANDTGAYIVGSLFGKHRLAERISPKKSWEGLIGGLLLSIAVSFVFAHFEQIIPLYHWIGLSIAVSIFATLGDLIESLIKRTLAVKDSGRTLPGHGGFLDRFDSLLLAVYALLFYIQLLAI